MTTAEAPFRLERPPESAASSGSVYLRVPVTKEAGNWIEVFYIPDNGTDEVREDPSVALRFPDLAEWWHSDTDSMSTDREKFEHEAYQRILKLGKPAVRHILQDLRDNHGHWYSALRELTGETNVDANIRGNIGRARDAWLSWGKTRKLI